jgi:hypothetical protein
MLGSAKKLPSVLGPGGSIVRARWSRSKDEDRKLSVSEFELGLARSECGVCISVGGGMSAID